MESFEIEKQNALNKIDKSNEQKWDDKVKPLCDKINSFKNYFTTSSCAGRITLIKTSTKKIKDAFLFKSHEKISLSDIFELLNVSENIIYFRQEPSALHVACKSLKDAIFILEKAKNSGFKRSGIISNKEKFVCEIVSTEWIIVPIIKKGKLLVNKEFLEILISEANKKLEKTWKKINIFYDSLN